MPVLNNARHERFAQEIAKGKTATEAYKVAGYKDHDGNASKLRAKVADRVEEITQRGAQRAEVTVASILQELEEARFLAMTIKRPAPAVLAAMGKAKVAGLLVERTEHTGKDGGPIETKDVSARDIIADKLAGLAARNGTKGDTGEPE